VSSDETGRMQRDSIHGERIDSQARKYVRLHDIEDEDTGKIQPAFRLEINAYCSVSKKLRNGGNATSELPAIHGDKIRVLADKHDRIGLTTGSSRHKIQQCRHSGDAFAVILKPLRYLHLNS